MLFGCWFTVNTYLSVVASLMVTWTPPPTHTHTPKFHHQSRMSTLNSRGTPTLAVHHLCMYHWLFSSQWAFGSLFETLCFGRETLSHRPHPHIIDPCVTLVQSCLLLCCFLEPKRGDLMLTRPPQDEKQTPIWTPRVCPLSSPWAFLIVVYISIR